MDLTEDIMEKELTHINGQGRARMVDVSDKDITERIAVARGEIWMKSETFERIKKGEIKKGDVLAVAQVAGIMAAKRTHEFIPMCHPLMLTGVDIEFKFSDEEDYRPPFPENREREKSGQAAVEAKAVVKTTGKTGVEMEALCAVNAALLTIYDMCKAIDRGMSIHDIYLLKKDGGKSGLYQLNGKNICAN